MRRVFTRSHACGLATRFGNQEGCAGAPPFEPMSTKSLPSRKKKRGTERRSPLVRPMVVSMAVGT